MIEKNKKVTNYVVNLQEKDMERLKVILKEQSWKIEPFQYAYWKATKDNTNIIAYTSGKLVVQGMGTEDFILYILEPQILKSASFGYEDLNFSPHIGIDESGKGDFFGPLVVAAVFVDKSTLKHLIKIGVTDSKKIKSEKKIIFLAKEIKTTVENNYSIVTIGPEAYNRLYDKFKNLNKMLAWGHARALENILAKDINCSWALSDKFGDEKLILQTLFEKGKTIELKQQTKAEADIAVAAASILARAEFVTRLERLGNNIEMKLPKGAGVAVVDTTVKIIRDFGLEKLGTIAKVHFKTIEVAKAYLKSD